MRYEYNNKSESQAVSALRQGDSSVNVSTAKGRSLHRHCRAGKYKRTWKRFAGMLGVSYQYRYTDTAVVRSTYDQSSGETQSSTSTAAVYNPALRHDQLCCLLQDCCCCCPSYNCKKQFNESKLGLKAAGLALR